MKTMFISLFTVTSVVNFKKHSLSSSFKVQQSVAGLEHLPSPYSPDFVPNNFQLFPKLICRSTVFYRKDCVLTISRPSEGTLHGCSDIIGQKIVVLNSTQLQYITCIWYSTPNKVQIHDTRRLFNVFEINTMNLSCQFLSLFKNVFKTKQIWMNMERLIGEDMEEQLPNLFSNIISVWLMSPLCAMINPVIKCKVWITQ